MKTWMTPVVSGAFLMRVAIATFMLSEICHFRTRLFASTYSPENLIVVLSMEITIGKAGGRECKIDAQELVTGRTCIIAQSGAGKSWSIAVLCEQLCKHGIGFCLIDTEGEYFSLKEKFDITWVGADEECDVDIEKVNLKSLISEAVRESKAIIYDVSEVEMIPRVTRLAHVLYDVATELRKPYLLLVEEADKFIPQSRDSIKKIEEISRRGRKRGLGLLVATQRPAIVTKNILSQCNSQIIGKLSIENDLKAVSLFFSSKQEVEELTTLIPGDFFIMGSLVSEKTKMRFGKRVTKHSGQTPRLELHPPAEPEPEPEAEPEPGSGSENECNPVEDVIFDPENEVSPDEIAKPVIEKPVKIPVKKIKSKSRKIKPRKNVQKRDAVVPVFEREDALIVAQKKQKKKFLCFGEEEKVVSAEMVYWPLVFFEVRYISGRLKKVTRTTSFILDGLKGNCANISNGLSLRPCFSELMDLDVDQIKVITSMPLSGATLVEIEILTKLPPAAVERAVDKLEDRKLITASDSVGDNNIYVPLLSHPVPKPGTRQNKIELKMEPLEGESRSPEIQEDNIRTILKVLEPTSEITEYRVFYYPVFEVNLATESGERFIYIDAVTGREIDARIMD